MDSRNYWPPASPVGTVKPKVFVVVYNPVCHSQQGRLLTEVCGYNDPEELTRDYVRDLMEVSGGYLQYQIVATIHLDTFPRKADGFCYTETSFLRCFREGSGWHQPDAVDYPHLLHQTGALELVEAGKVDEVWVWGPPYAGLWESTMVGPGAYFCNSEPVPGISCSRRFIIMGFNYERGVGEMLENFGHRAESMLARAFGSWREWGGRDNHAWDRFTAYDLVSPGQAGCGTVHFAPNSERDYDWGNRRQVWSTCDAWPFYPDRSMSRRLVDCREWGGGDIRAHHKWWLAHLPRSQGTTDGIANNWWSYIVDPGLAGEEGPAARD